MVSLPLELSIAHIERAINHALSHSVYWCDYADKLNGRFIRCDLSPPDLQVYVRINNGLVYLSTSGSEQIDLTITATPSALLEMAQHKRAGSHMNISGNAHLAQTLQQAINQVDIDWEGVLADHFGEIPGKQLMNAFGKLKSFATRLASTLVSDSADYFVDETQLLPAQYEVENFSQEVTTLRYDTDRIEARIRRLEQDHV